jgi:hypothetical protein
MRAFKYIGVGVGLVLAIIAYNSYARQDRERKALEQTTELRKEIKSLGFRPGDRYCYIADAYKNSNGYHCCPKHDGSVLMSVESRRFEGSKSGISG